MDDAFVPLDSQEKNVTTHVAKGSLVLSVIQRAVVTTERSVTIDLDLATVRQVGEALLVAFLAGEDKRVFGATSATVKTVQDVTL